MIIKNQLLFRNSQDALILPEKKQKTPFPESDFSAEQKSPLCQLFCLPAELKLSEAKLEPGRVPFSRVPDDELPPLLAPLASICDLYLSSLSSGSSTALSSPIVGHYHLNGPEMPINENIQLLEGGNEPPFLTIK